MRAIRNILNAFRWLVLNRYIFLKIYRFKHFGSQSYIVKPLQIDGFENITIGNNVIVSSRSWMAALPLTGQKVQLLLNDGVHLGHYNHIYATQSIIIEKDVLTADKVYIGDNLHSYKDTTIPIAKQPIIQCKPVVIGEGSWLGENVCVIGASVGKHSVIGANSVVTKDIPDYCVAVGCPARVIKRYDLNTEEWIKL